MFVSCVISMFSTYIWGIRYSNGVIGVTRASAFRKRVRGVITRINNDSRASLRALNSASLSISSARESIVVQSLYIDRRYARTRENLMKNLFCTICMGSNSVCAHAIQA